MKILVIRIFIIIIIHINNVANYYTKLKFNKIPEILVFLYVVFTILVPILFVNKLIFIFILFHLFLFNKEVKITFFSNILIIFSIFIYGYIISLFNLSDSSLRNQLLLWPTTLFLLTYIKIYKVDLDNIFINAGLILSVITFYYFFNVLLGINNASNYDMPTWISQYSSGVVADKTISTDTVFSAFRFGPVSFLTIPFCISINKAFQDRNIKYFLYSIIIFFIILSSYSRANITVSLIFFFVVLIKYSNKLLSKIIIYSCLLLLFVYFLRDFISNSTFFDAEELSNKTKLGHFSSYISTLNPVKFILGSGLATFYWSDGYMGYTAQTEITFLDTLRYFGFFLNLFLIIQVLIPNPKRFAFLLSNDPISFLIFFLYFISSFSNPILLNSYGVLAILWYWKKIAQAPLN